MDSRPKEKQIRKRNYKIALMTIFIGTTIITDIIGRYSYLANVTFILGICIGIMIYSIYMQEVLHNMIYKEESKANENKLSED